MIEKLLGTFRSRYPLTESSAEPFRTLKANGMSFLIRSFDAEGLGHVSVMSAKGFFGLMKMDTLIINPLKKDLPLYSYDRIHAMGNDTLIIELYDTMTGPSDFSSVEAVNRSFSALPDLPRKSQWYDSIKLPVSISKKGKSSLSGAFDELAEKHLLSFLSIEPDHECDASEKRKKASVYVEGLLENGGPSTDVFMKAIGKEQASRLFRTVLFGTAEQQ